MKKISILFIILTGYTLSSFSAINPKDVTIIRDTFGIPHIYGNTDADAVYGLAYAHCEDAFKLIQYNLLPTKNKLGSVMGKKGVLLDYAMQFFGVDTLVENRYNAAISPSFKKILEAYIQGVNDYAYKHPSEVLVKSSFPFSPQDVIKGYVGLGILMAGAGLDLKAIKGNLIEEVFQPNERGSGSNAIVLAPSRTEDGNAWLLSNSHQPIEGPMAWYEAHVNSNEGWNMLGALFPGGVSLFLGSNEYLGWTHTTDYHHFGDIYQLTLSNSKKQYYYDHNWRNFDYKTIHLKIKVGKLTLPIKRKIPVCEFGPVFKTKHGWYALRYPSASDIRQAEQWYWMNKAKNFTEFEAAIKMQALPLFNTLYADRAGNIFFISDGKIPLRDSSINWRRPLIGISSDYKWTNLLPYERKIKYLNPRCGFLFNCNGTPLQATAYDENSKDYFVGLQLFTYNRNERFSRLLNEHSGLFTWHDLKRIKYDHSYDTSGTYRRNFNAIWNLDVNKYASLKDIITKLKAWNLSGDKNDKNAAVAMLTNKFLANDSKLPYAFLMIKKEPLTEEEVINALKKTKKYLLKTYQTIDVKLGDVQQLLRGKKNYSISGLAEVPRAIDTKYDKKNIIYKMTAGDSYIQFAKFGKEGVYLETISPFGASSHADSKHYTDQMELFANEKTKIMSLNKEDVIKSAERIYHPGE